MGPTNFGNGDNGSYPATGTGDGVGFNASLYGSQPRLCLPQGYVSGTELTSGAFWPFDVTTVTPGTYTWTWGSAAEQSFTIVIPTYNTAEPAALGMFGFGVLLLGGFFALRHREQRRQI